MTWDHRYYASPDMFANDPINKDFTQEYKDSLYLGMKQIFENNIAPQLESERQAHKKELEELQDALFWNTQKVDEMTDESPININVIFDIDGYRTINKNIEASCKRNKT